MNIDLYGLFDFGDEAGVKTFVFAHRVTHEAEAQALAQQQGVVLDTFALGGEDIIEPWIDLMNGTRNDFPDEIREWLERHNKNHQDMMLYLASSLTDTTIGLTDISMVDFSDPEQMFNWLSIHQSMHDLQEQALGIT